MKAYRRMDYAQGLLYGVLLLALLFLRCVGKNAEPLSLALVYAMCTAGLSPVISGVLFFLSSCVCVQGIEMIIAFAQALLLVGGCALERTCKKMQLKGTWSISFVALALALGLFVAFSPFTVYEIAVPLIAPPLWQKVCIAALIFLLSAVFSVALKALLRKLLKCRLRGEEMIFIVLFLVLVGVGICQLLGFNAYMGIALFVLLLFSCVTKDFSTLLCAFVVALPPALVVSISPERFFVYGVMIAVFSKSGRLASSLALLAVFFCYGYFDGIYGYPTGALVQAVLSAVLPVLLFVLLPAPLIRRLENKLVFYREKHVSRIAINRNRALIGEQLFEISAVFKEIQSTFSALGTTEAEQSAKEYMCGCVLREVCKSCAAYAVCRKKGVLKDLHTLIDIGCQKGKVHLMDVPTRLAEACGNPSGVLYALNKQIGEYKRYMLETENAANGRALLAGQAEGVSEILKNLAVEQSEPLKMYTDKERALTTALLRVGIVCSELLIYGEEDNVTLSLVTFGKADVKKIAAVASELLGMPMMITQRIALSGDKFGCVLRKKPHYDAAFGVACMKKDGETASGDTHSVIKIDERKFMVALSDGMGSGEYARRVSECTISLLESFYRAKMPSSLVLSAINTLLTFSKEETFACVDIAIVDLADGVADIVKIGSPVGFILSGNTVKVLDSSSLPLGILDSLHPETNSYTLLENDVLLFLSDGITGAFGSTADLYDVLKNIPATNPQQLVDLLLENALAAYGGEAKDDMTALAVRLFKNVG